MAVCKIVFPIITFRESVDKKVVFWTTTTRLPFVEREPPVNSKFVISANCSI